MSKIRKYWKSIVFSLSIFIFVVIATLLVKDKISLFDDKVYEIISKLRCEPLTIFFKVITFLCSVEFLVTATICVMLFSETRRNAFYITLNMLMCLLLNQGLKHIFMRTRPEGINLIIEGGYSFPSGHSMVSLALYGFFIYLIVHMKMKRSKKIIYSILLSLLVLLIGISRIYLGVHFASDVLAGFAISMAYLIIFIKLFYKKMNMY